MNEKIEEATLKLINLSVAKALFLSALTFAEQAGIDSVDLIPLSIIEELKNNN